MDGSITLLLEKSGKLHGKITLSENDFKSNPENSKHDVGTIATECYMRTNRSKALTPILNAGTQIKQNIRNFIFRTGISPAQETEAWKCFSIPKEPAVISVTTTKGASPILVTASLSQTAQEILATNQAILNIEIIQPYRLFTSDDQWVEDNMQLGEFGTTNFTLEKAKNVIIRKPTGMSIMYFWDSELVTEFYKRVSQNASGDLYLSCAGYPLLEHRQMRDTNVRDFSTVLAHPLLLGGGETLTCDVDLSNAPTMEGKGARDGPTWLIYDEGLNILCQCSNAECPSFKSNVVVPLGYPLLETLLPGKIMYKCPACGSTDLSIVTFVVSNARAKFTYLKCSSNKVEIVMLESTSDQSEDYTLFTESDLSDNEKFEYDYIVIATVKFGMSFNKCQQCNQTVRLNEEKFMSCGRAFHSSCLNLNKKCPVCDLSDYELTDLDKIVASTTSHESVTLHLPNHEFGSCKSTNKVVPKYIGLPYLTKMPKSVKWQSSDLNPENNLESQQDFIAGNLPALIRDTIVYTTVIAELRQLDLLSCDDEETLKSIRKETEKAREMYRIIGTRVGGIKTLIDILKKGCQSGAVATLSGYVKR